MAKEDHLQILKQGVAVWNKWRLQASDLQPDLHSADLEKANLRNANLRNTDLGGSKLNEADLRNADLSEANLSLAHLEKANLCEANLRGSDLTGADFGFSNLNDADISNAELYSTRFWGASLRGANLNGVIARGVDLRGADLTRATLVNANLLAADMIETILCQSNLTNANLKFARMVRCNLTGADLSDCSIYGISAWEWSLNSAKQSNLVITSDEESLITVDDLEVAQFIYLMLNNERLRSIIDTITSKVVLILGRFSPERKFVLDKIKEELRKNNYLPVLFDFEKPVSRDFTETISLLAGMARFIIADISEPKSIQKELEAIISNFAVPIQPLIVDSDRPYSMFADYWKYSWVLEVHSYNNIEELFNHFKEKIIIPAENKVQELREQRNK